RGHCPVWASAGHQPFPCVPRPALLPSRGTAMRQAKSGRTPRGRGLLGLVALAALVPPAWAYVNGGDYHNTLRDYEKRLKADGWGVSSAESVWGRLAVNQL